VGKSTLFNALLKRQQALAANYPFATIEPNVGIVEIPDPRLLKLAEVIKDSESMDSLPPLVHAVIEFVDIAGIVAGASKGEGLGNKFLSHIRETDLICHVLRAFADEDIVLTGKLDPLEDLVTIRTELILKDLETLEKKEKSLKKSTDPKIMRVYQNLCDLLDSGKPARELKDLESRDEETREWFRDLHLLSAKSEIFVINVSESQIGDRSIETRYQELIGVTGEELLVMSARIESELSDLNEADRETYLQDLGVKESGIEKMARAAYRKLGLISFLTAGEKEVRAWTVSAGSTAVRASGVIHTDFMNKFIKADVCSFEDFIKANGWKGAREIGKVRTESKDYVVRDGDVVEFKIGA